MILLVLPLGVNAYTNSDFRSLYEFDDSLEDEGLLNITLTGSTPSYATGKVGQASWSNNDKRFNMAVSSYSLQVDNNFTMCYWVNITANGGFYTIIDGRSSSIATPYLFWLNGASWYMQDSARSNTFGVKDLNNWQHNCIVQNHLNITNYQNGVVVSTSTTNKMQLGTGTGNIYIQKNSININGLVGGLDQLFMSGRPFEAEEIRDIYNNGDGKVLLLTQSNFSITAIDSETSSTITNFNATIDGTLYNSIGGQINTTILDNSTSLYDIDLTSVGYYSRTYSNYNVSSNLEGSLTPYSMTFINQTPANNTQHSETELNFNLTIDYSGNPTTTNCSLMVNNIITYSETTASNGTILLNTAISSLSNTNYYNWTCYNDYVTLQTPTYLFYSDAVIPAIVTNFIDNSVYFKENITSQFNFTDDQILFKYNITIDGVTHASQSGLSGTAYQYNFSIDAENLTKGKHILGLLLWDGHTAENLTDKYKTSTGIFKDVLKLKSTNNIKIESKDKSFFDTWTSKEEIDRHTFSFNPAKEKKTEVFIVNTEEPLEIISRPDLPYKEWIVSGDKWIDFKIKDQTDFTISIKKIDDYTAEVSLGNVKKYPIEFESIGELNLFSTNYSFYVLNASVSSSDVSFEGAINNFNLYLDMEDINTTKQSVYFTWEDTNFAHIKRINTSNDFIEYRNSFVTPKPSTTLINWTYYFNFSSTMYNISGNQTAYAINITNCTSGNIVFNFTVYNESTKVKLANPTIETSLTLKSYQNTSQTWDFSTLKHGNDLTICMPDILNASDYLIDAITKYESSANVPEYHYLVNVNLTKANTPINIPLYDLSTDDSTSFLITYKNENYLPMRNRIVDILRYYISTGEFISVEHGKTDPAGQTNAHLVTEDIIYSFNVYYEGELEYSTPQYKALCQAVPCTILISQEGETTTTTIDNYNIDLTYNEETRISTLRFSTKDGSSAVINLTTYLNNGYDNTSVCSSQVLASAGTLNCQIPTTAITNNSYIVKIKEGYNSSTLGYRLITIQDSAFDRFGGTGIIITAFSFITLAFMGIGSGIMVIIMGFLGLALASMLMFFDAGGMFGIGSSIIWLFCAGLIIIWKLTKRRVQ